MGWFEVSADSWLSLTFPSQPQPLYLKSYNDDETIYVLSMGYVKSGWPDCQEEGGMVGFGFKQEALNKCPCRLIT